MASTQSSKDTEHDTDTETETEVEEDPMVGFLRALEMGNPDSFEEPSGQPASVPHRMTVTPNRTETLNQILLESRSHLQSPFLADPEDVFKEFDQGPRPFGPRHIFGIGPRICRRRFHQPEPILPEQLSPEALGFLRAARHYASTRKPYPLAKEEERADIIQVKYNYKKNLCPGKFNVKTHLTMKKCHKIRTKPIFCLSKKFQKITPAQPKKMKKAKKVPFGHLESPRGTEWTHKARLEMMDIISRSCRNFQKAMNEKGFD